MSRMILGPVLRMSPPGGIEEVIYDLKHSAEALSAEDQRALAEVYSESGVSVDGFCPRSSTAAQTDREIQSEDWKSRHGRKVAIRNAPNAEAWRFAGLSS
jgi:hypothetical protein